MRQAVKTGEYSAQITFSDGTALDVDFTDVIKEFKLEKLKSFVLCHWQSRPKGLRGYGYFDSTSKTYNCIDWNNVLITKCAIRPLQLDENVFVKVPTAVLLFPNMKLQKLPKDTWLIS